MLWEPPLGGYMREKENTKAPKNSILLYPMDRVFSIVRLQGFYEKAPELSSEKFKTVRIYKHLEDDEKPYPACTIWTKECSLLAGQGGSISREWKPNVILHEKR